VTGLAGIAGGQVSAPLATRYHRVVATDAAAADLQVIDPQDWQPAKVVWQLSQLELLLM